MWERPKLTTAYVLLMITHAWLGPARRNHSLLSAKTFFLAVGDNRPLLPTRASGRSPSPKPWMKKPIAEAAPTSPALEEPMVKEEEEEDQPPSIPPPARPPVKKPIAGRSWEKKETGSPPARPPMKKGIGGGKPPHEERKETKAVPTWLKKSAEKEEEKPTETSPGGKDWKKDTPTPKLQQKELPKVSATSPSMRNRTSASEPGPKETTTSPDSVSSSPKGPPKQFSYR